MKIRLAKISDASSLLEIYSQYIETAITFEYILPTVSEFEKRMLPRNEAERGFYKEDSR